MAWAPEDTVTIRAGALALSRSRSRSVSRNGARWLTAKVCSSASAVTRRGAQTPAPGGAAPGGPALAPLRGQAEGCGLADPAGAAGDQNRLAGHRAGGDVNH